VPLLKQAGHEIIDFGCETTGTCDYMDYAFPAAHTVADGKAEVGILFDGSGLGMSIAANKVFSIRAGVAHDEITARTAREKNHCNVLCLGADLLSDAQMRKIVQAFLGTPCGEGRHARRVQKLCAMEREEFAGGPKRKRDLAPIIALTAPPTAVSMQQAD
jgi:ribose 5-phosphate isomerase B